MKIIIDCSYLCHRARYANTTIHGEDLREIIVYNFMNTILSIGKRFRTNQFIFTWDSKKSKRKVIYPNYKNRQKPDMSEVEKIDLYATYNAMDYCRTTLIPLIGFNNSFNQVGHEADDIISVLVGTLNYLEEQHIIVATDQDLYQLLTPHTSMYNPTTKEIYDSDSLFKEYNCTYSDYGKAKGITGCSTDTVEGIKGVGIKTALKYLNGALKKTSVKYQAIVDNPDAIKLTRQLTVLPFKGTRIPEIVKDELDYEEFKDLCETLQWNNYLTKRADEVRDFFAGRF